MFLPLSGSAVAAVGSETPPVLRAPLAVLRAPLAALPAYGPRLSDLPGAPPPPAWQDIPIAVPLHPVAFHYGRRYQELLAETMGGPHASPVFGPIVAEADVHWRLLAATGEGLPIDAETSALWRDAALAGSLLSFTGLLDDTLDRAPALRTIWTIGDALLSPSLDASRGDAGTVVTHRNGGQARRAIERQEEQLGEPRLTRKPDPAIGTGVDWELRDADAPPSAPLVQYTAWVSTTAIGLSSMRAELAPFSLAWNIGAREMLVPGVSLIGSARSVDRGPEPALLSGGVMWQLPGPLPWSLRFERILTFDEPDERWMITLRCENRSNIPAPLAPPLGDRGRPGLELPWVPALTANTVQGW